MKLVPATHAWLAPIYRTLHSPIPVNMDTAYPCHWQHHPPVIIITLAIVLSADDPTEDDCIRVWRGDLRLKYDGGSYGRVSVRGASRTRVRDRLKYSWGIITPESRCRCTEAAGINLCPSVRTDNEASVLCPNGGNNCTAKDIAVIRTSCVTDLSS